MNITEKVCSKYTLRNYYRKRLYTWPDTLPEIYDYYELYGELPFRYEGSNLPYDIMCERQRRRGVTLSQYLTPDRTAAQMARLTVQYRNERRPILDAGCGTGQLTRALLAEGVLPTEILALDADRDMTEIFKRLYPQIPVSRMLFRELASCPNVIANPPFEVVDCLDFLLWLGEAQYPGCHSVLLLPNGFIDKVRPASVCKVMGRFILHNRTEMTEPFAGTNILAEIVVLERI